jgi:hypothetical protein
MWRLHEDSLNSGTEIAWRHRCLSSVTQLFPLNCAGATQWRPTDGGGDDGTSPLPFYPCIPLQIDERKALVISRPNVSLLIARIYRVITCVRLWVWGPS